MLPNQNIKSWERWALLLRKIEILWVVREIISCEAYGDEDLQLIGSIKDLLSDTISY